MHTVDANECDQEGQVGLPGLNFDILSQIISLLTRREVASLSSTCRVLRSVLSPELPRGGVALEGQHLMSFLLFADMKHGEDRLRYFRGVVLPGSTYRSILYGKQAISIKDVGRALSTIMLAARNLESLSILHLDVLSFRPDTLKKMLNSLPRIRELELSAVQKTYEGVLESVLPHLHTLVIECVDGCNASALLRPHPDAPQCELQEVALYNAAFGNVSVSFPTVHTLRARPARLPSGVDALTRIFPNVRHFILDLHPDYGRVDSEYRKEAWWYRPDIPWADPVAKTWRDRLLSRPQQKAGAWPHLQSLRMSGTGTGIRKAVWAGLARQVPRVEVGSQLMAVQQLAGVLGELRPSGLVLHPGVFHGTYASGKKGSGGWGLLRALEGAPCVTRLAVVLCQAMKGLLWHFLPRSVEGLGECSVSCLLLRLDFEHPVSGALLERLETWRGAMSSKVPSLRIILFQIKDRVPLGWVREEHAQAGKGLWMEMSENERRDLVASEKICPPSPEPCEICTSASRQRLH